MRKEYTTISGDTWDMIAYKLYGDCSYMDKMLQANQKHAKTVIFSAGAVLTVPEISTAERETENLPPWKRTEA